MVPGYRDLHGAAEGLLAFDFGEIASSLGCGRGPPAAARRGIDRGELRLTAEKAHGAVQRVYAIHRHALDERRFLGGDRGQEHAALLQRAGEPRHCQRATDRPGRPGETEFARDQPVAEIVSLELLRRGEDAERDRQIVKRPFLAQITRREIDRGARARRAKAAVGERGEHAVAGLLHGGIGQPDQKACGV